MAIFLQQTDTASACSPVAFCSGASLNTDVDYEKQATVGGTAGSTGVTVTVNASAADLACGWYECLIPSDATWAAGNWVVRLNVTTIQSTVTWDATYICRVNSSCTNQETLGSLTGQAISLGTSGVKTMTVNQAAEATPTAGDKVMIVLLFDNSNSCTRNVGLTPSELIDCPYTQPVTDVFFEYHHPIEQGMKPNTAAGMGGVLVE